jgi:hypothetical protein
MGGKESCLTASSFPKTAMINQLTPAENIPGSPQINVGKAHQRKIREDRQQEAQKENLFGAWWEGLEIDIKKAVVKPIDRKTCETIILEYEWLGCMPSVVWFMFGIFFDGACGGVVCYGPEYSENLGKQAREQGRKCADWSKYGFEGKMILLSRGACTHWAHPHSGSKLIRESMRQLPSKFEVVTCTVDHAAGEIGTIYQACGFHYVGSMREANPAVKSRKMDRDGWMIDGKIWSSRSIRQRCGTTKESDIKAVFPKAIKIKQHSKHRYFAFMGSKVAQKTHWKAIAHLVKPYPKRAKL